MTSTPTESYSFSSIEQVDKMTHDLGWATEYNQLQKGPFSSSFTVQRNASWFLMEEQSNRSVQVQAPAPSEMYVLAFIEGPPGSVNSQLLDASRVFIQCPDTEFQATLTAGMTVTQIGVLADQFEETIYFFAPDIEISLTGVNSMAADPKRLANIQLAIRNALTNPAPRDAIQQELVSEILVKSLNTLFGQQNAPRSTKLHREGARRALVRATDYIESHLTESIRIPAICSYASTTPRSLERIFYREFGVSPQQYVKARRLNAVHRRLLFIERDKSVKISDVASSYGLSHMGRFSQDYKHFFGRSPRETLMHHESIQTRSAQ